MTSKSTKRDDGEWVTFTDAVKFAARKFGLDEYDVAKAMIELTESGHQHHKSPLLSSDAC